MLFATPNVICLPYVICHLANPFRETSDQETRPPTGALSSWCALSTSKSHFFVSQRHIHTVSNALIALQMPCKWNNIFSFICSMESAATRLERAPATCRTGHDMRRIRRRSFCMNLSRYPWSCRKMRGHVNVMMLLCHSCRHVTTFFPFKLSCLFLY